MTMSKRKSIADLIATKPLSRKPSLEDVDQITTKIHQSQHSIKQTEKGKSKKISLIAPINLYLKAKTKATMQDQSLMAYILELIDKDSFAQTLK